MSDWITCEGGACVQYRTEGDTVTIRSTVTAEQMRLTVAAWETFVAGLTAEVTAERDAVAADHRSTFSTARSVVDTLAAENARLRQQVAELKDERDFHVAHVEQIATLADTISAEKSRLRQQLAAAEDERDRLTGALARTELQRDTEHRRHLEAVAEAAMVRHQIRELHAPTLESVEWFHDQTGKGKALVCPSCRPADPTEWNPPIGQAGIEPPGFVPSYVLSPCPTLVAVQEASATPPESTLPAEQAPVEALATDGAEPQGEAQRAAGASWLAQQFHETYERLAPSFGYETREASAKPWADVPEQNRRLMIAVCAELLPAIENWLLPVRMVAVLPEPAPATGGIIPPGARFAVEPDPVERWVPFVKPLCREQYPGGDPTARIVRCGLPLDHEGNHDEMIDGERGNHWPRKPAADNDHDPDGAITVTMDNTGKGWLTASPAKPVTFVTCGCWFCRSARAMYTANHLVGEKGPVLLTKSVDSEVFPNATSNHPDDEVPETGRAGEARHPTGPLPPMPEEFYAVDGVPIPAQERTEGLDAAIEAGWLEYLGAAGTSTDRDRFVAGLRAASPLIERAARAELERVIRRVLDRHATINTLCDADEYELNRALRDRATRTEGS